MPEDQPGRTDAERLARKLRGLQLSTGERELLTRVLAAAALVGVTVGIGEVIGASSPSQVQPPSTVIESMVDLGAPRWDDISGQFHGSFTPGEAWETPLNISVKPPH